MEAINLMDKEMVDVRRLRTYYAIFAAFLLLILVYCVDIEISYPTLGFIISVGEVKV